MVEAAKMCLLLGPTTVGKTLFLKKLEAFDSTTTVHDHGMGLSDSPATIATVGTILANVPVSRKQTITVREVGGSMGPIWQNYYKDCQALMYMIDISNRLQTASACIQLLSVLSSDTLPKVPLLIIFNKIDMPDKMTSNEIDTLFRLSDIIKHTDQPIQTVDTSALTGKGLTEVIKWLDQNCGNK